MNKIFLADHDTSTLHQVFRGCEFDGFQIHSDNCYDESNGILKEEIFTEISQNLNLWFVHLHDRNGVVEQISTIEGNSCHAVYFVSSEVDDNPREGFSDGNRHFFFMGDSICRHNQETLREIIEHINNLYNGNGN
jgi:hypothetical protein